MVHVIIYKEFPLNIRKIFVISMARGPIQEVPTYKEWKSSLGKT